MVIDLDRVLSFGDGYLSRPVYGHDSAIIGKADPLQRSFQVHMLANLEFDKLNQPPAKLAVHQ